MTDKRALRARMRGVRDMFGNTGLPVAPAFLAALRPDMVVAGYQPIGGEANPAPLLDAAREYGCLVALPWVVDHETPLRFLVHAPGDPLVAGPFGLRQPALSAPEVRPDVVLTPLVAFDRRGNRLGQGASHYDRAFAALPDAWRVGVAWSVQELPDIPVDAWDMPLHVVATEKEWIVPMTTTR